MKISSSGLVVILLAGVEATAGIQLSPGGDHLLVPDRQHGRFTVCATTVPECLEVGPTLTGGSMARWSPDGRWVGFKVVQVTPEGARLQAPALLDLVNEEVRLLAPPAPVAGNPAFSADGHVAFTVGDEAALLDPDLEPVASAALPHHVNWLALAPDAASVLYNDRDEQIVRLSWATGRRERLTAGDAAYCRPEYAPDGSAVLVATVGGELRLVDLADGSTRTLGAGDDPVWSADGRAVIASQRVFVDDRLVDVRLLRFARDGAVEVLAVDPALRPRQPAPAAGGDALYFVAEPGGELVRARLDRSGQLTGVERVPLPPAARRVVVPELARSVGDAEQLASLRALAVIRGVPYHHQVHDTPGWFDGSGACGATAATMAIQFYDTLPDWDFQATSPFDHTSHFGSYVSEVYTFNAVTYDVLADGGYGGHGWIWQAPVDTKEHMRSFIAQHGLSSPAVDWSPTWAELQSEVAARTPFVLLSSITTAGHYKTVTGYIEGQHTAHFNDPWGDKNQGYPNYNGAGTSYDWPGYNNGYENLNAVHCYVYARATPPPEPDGTVADPIVVPAFPYHDSNTTRTSNGSDELDAYSCAPGVDEQGREIVYRFTVPTSGTLSADVACDGEVDVDLHLLSAPAAASCLTRAHIAFDQWIAAGTYWLACDSYHAAGSDLMGDYTLTLGFVSDLVPLIFADGFDSGDTAAWTTGAEP